MSVSEEKTQGPMDSRVPSSSDLEKGFDEKEISKAKDDAGSDSTSESATPVRRLSLAELEETLTNAKDWAGPEDPANGLNWPMKRKVFQSIVIAMLANTCALATSIITPGLTQIAEEFHASATVARLAYSIFVLGMAMGAIIAAPISETLGRRAVYLIAMPTFGLFVLGTGFSQNIWSLIICRFFAGVFASPSVSTGSGTLADIWTPKERGLPLALYITAPFLGPALGPMLGGFLVVNKGWRWTSWTVLFFMVVSTIPALFMEETYKRVVLEKRAKRLSIPGPESPFAELSKKQVAKRFATSVLVRPLHMLFTEPVVAAFSSYIAFNFALLYAFFTAFPWVFATYYDFSLTSIGLTFLSVGVGCLTGLALAVTVDALVYKPRLAELRKRTNNPTARLDPEQRLYIGMIGSITLPAGLFLFGWSASYKVHWIVPCIGEAMFGMSSLLIFMMAMFYILDFYGPLYGASGMGANVILRYTLGAAFPLFSVQMYEGLGVGWASSLLGFLAIALAGTPFIFFKYGEKLRKRSAYVEQSR